MKIKDLKPAKYNPRNITDKKLKMLSDSMLEFGDLSGIVFNIKTKRLVAGHQRIKQLDPLWKIEKKPHKDKTGTVATGYVVTPQGRWQYREVDWSEKKELAANIAANAHGGEFDIPKLKDIIVSIDDGSIDMGLTGFDDNEIKVILDFEKIPDLTKTPEFEDKDPLLSWQLWLPVSKGKDFSKKLEKFLKDYEFVICKK